MHILQGFKVHLATLYGVLPNVIIMLIKRHKKKKLPWRFVEYKAKISKRPSFCHETCKAAVAVSQGQLSNCCQPKLLFKMRATAYLSSRHSDTVKRKGYMRAVMRLPLNQWTMCGMWHSKGLVFLRFYFNTPSFLMLITGDKSHPASPCAALTYGTGRFDLQWRQNKDVWNAE